MNYVRGQNLMITVVDVVPRFEVVLFRYFLNDVFRCSVERKPDVVQNNEFFAPQQL